MANMKRITKPGARQDVERISPIPQASPTAENASPPAPKAAYRVERWAVSHAPNPAMLRNMLVKEGYTVYQWSDPPGTIYGMHRHTTAQSHWIVCGQLEIKVAGGGTFLLGAGDRDIMPANTLHSATVVGDEPALYLVGELVPYNPQR
jgi:quercetin dioxygenase-like cupin family protein